jgi:two-component system nitrogen regulation response regulator GlnG
MSAQNNILTAITATERGAYEYLPKPFDLKELTAIVQRALAAPQRKRATAEMEQGDERLPLIGRSPAMQEIYRIIARLTQADLTVMIRASRAPARNWWRARCTITANAATEASSP